MSPMKSELDDRVKTLVDSLNSEMNRFWTRFNIFAAVQVVAVVGLLTNEGRLGQNPVFTWSTLLIVLGWSIVGAVATVRGHDLQRALVLTILDIEGELPSSSRFFGRVLTKTKLPRYINNTACIIFAIGCVLYWTLVLILGP